MNIFQGKVSTQQSLYKAFFTPIVLSLVCISLYFATNYLVFHTVVEMFTIYITLTTVTVAFTTNQFTKNHFIVFLAIAFGWCSILDLSHLLVYKGLNLIPDGGSNKSTQFWVAGRYAQVIAILFSTYFLRKDLPLWVINLFFGVLTLGFEAAIFSHHFFNTFIEGQGLTPFKIISEWVFILLLVISIVRFKYEKNMMSHQLYLYIQTAVIMMLLSEISFSYYPNVFSIQNIFGHVFRIFTYWFIYLSLVITTLREPFNALARAASTYDTIPNPTLIIQNNGTIFQANIAAGLFTHTVPEQLVGLSSHSLFHNNTVPKEQCPVCKHLLTCRDKAQIELNRENKNWVKCSVSPISSGQYEEYWVEVIEDISNQKQLELEREQLIHHLENSNKELISLYNIVQYSSPTDKNIMVSIDQLLSNAVFEIVNALQHPENKVVQIESEWGTYSTASEINKSFYTIENKIIVNNDSRGTLRVFYLEQTSDVNQIFSAEECKFFEHISRQLGITISRILGLEKIKQLSYLYEMLSTTNRAALRCKNSTELLEALFNSMDKLNTFDILFIAKTVDSPFSYDILHAHGLSEEHKNHLDQAINNNVDAFNPLLNQLNAGNILDFAFTNEKNNTWSDYLYSHGIRQGYLIPFFCEEKLHGFIGAFSHRLKVSTTDQKNLLKQIADDISFALTGFASEEKTKLAIKSASSFERQFGEIFMASPLPMMIVSEEMDGIKSINKAFESWLGYSLDDFLSEKQLLKILFSNCFIDIKEQDTRSKDSDIEIQKPRNSIEININDKHNMSHVANAYLTNLDTDMLIAFIDITSIKKNEQALIENETHFRAMIEQTITGVFVYQNNRFVYTNPRFREIIGWSQYELMSKSLTDFIESTSEKEKYEQTKYVETGSFKLKLKRKDGALIIANIQKTMISWDSQPAELALIEDITEKVRIQDQIEEHVKRLEIAIKGIFTALSNMSELRDPYTAGHEKRVGLIAKEIAKEMGLSPRQSDYIELIGLVHDIGKIAVPSEILVKPTQLSPIEWQFIQIHPQAGFEILKNIPFNFPVAETILQHHERMDGSGYPKGLNNQEIILEARIIAVADVLDAMASHRPYRPAKGLDEALNEIMAGRETKYDPDVVDALMRLVNEKSYQLPTL